MLACDDAFSCSTLGNGHFGGAYKRLIAKPDQKKTDAVMPPDLRLRYGWPFPDMKDGLPMGFMAKSAIIIPIVGTLSRIWLTWLNNVAVYNGATYSWWVNKRAADQPLLTVCNHHSCLDDPLIYGILPWRTLWSAHRMRWSMAAHDVVFTTRITSWFFSTGKCVPTIRGIGVHQQAVDFCAARLREGSWVHVFPEGKVNDKHESLRLKWGIGRIILECYAGQDFLFKTEDINAVAENAASVKRQDTDEDLQSKPIAALKECGTKLTDILRKMKGSEKTVDSLGFGETVKTGVLSADSDMEWANASQLSRAVADRSGDTSAQDGEVHRNPSIPTIAKYPGKAPIVLPIYHYGMDSVLPNKQPYVPKIGQKVTIVVGQPIDTSQMLAEFQHRKIDPVEARRLLTDRIQREMNKLGSEAKHLHQQRLGGS